MAIDPNKFMDHLVSDLKPTRPLRPPWVRALFWISIFTVSTALVLHWVQEYRPNFWIQLNQYWRLKVEIISGALLTLSTFYMVFASSIPGTKINLWVKSTALASFLVFAGSMIAGFWGASPEASSLGARPFCEFEVWAYGGLAMGGLFYLTRKGIIVSHSLQNLLYGLSAGLISALLMQLACMYDPWHGLIFHFGPVALLGVVGWFVSQKVKSYMERKSKTLIHP